MPLITRVFVKTALVYFALALALGIALAFGINNGYFPSYIHMLVFGWLTQLIFGIVFWMFPKYSQELPRGHEWLGWVAYAALNLGLVLRVLAEPLQSTQPNAALGVALVASAVLQWLAGVAFIVNTWKRVREK